MAAAETIRSLDPNVQAITDELDRLGPLDDFVGLTMEEARGMVVGYTVYLPSVQK